MPLTLLDGVVENMAVDGGFFSTIDTRGADLLVVVTATWAARVSPGLQQDTEGLTYTAIDERIAQSNSVRLKTFYTLPGANTNAAHTVKVFGSSEFYASGAFLAFSGATPDPFDGQEAGTQTSSSVTSLAPGAVLPSSGPAALLAALGWDGASNTISINEGYGLLGQADYASGNNFGLAVALLNQDTDSPVQKNPTFSWSSGSKAAAYHSSFLLGAGTDPIPFGPPGSAYYRHCIAALRGGAA